MARQIILDANLLVLLVVGLTNRAFITKHKRLSAYREEDFDLLGTIVRNMELIVTPNTLTEASNLALQFGEPGRTEIATALRALILHSKETIVQSAAACEAAEFLRLGLSDVVQLSANVEGCSLLTADFDLYRAALMRGQEAQNFHHMRGLD